VIAFEKLFILFKSYVTQSTLQSLKESHLHQNLLLTGTNIQTFLFYLPWLAKNRDSQNTSLTQLNTK
jgi:hypothetical protein